jgi:hypothetical protein
MNRGQMVMEEISDRTNPVVVKELRQAVQSRLVIGILLLFLLANVLIVGCFLMFNADATTSERAGQELFSWQYAVLVATCMVFVTLYAAIRLTMERNDSNIDLLFITTIAPAAIIRGKFCAAVALTALIYSTSMPFLTFTYLLRGIDLPSIFFALGMAFFLTAGAIMLAIFVGSVPGGLLMRMIMAGAFLFVGFWTMSTTIIGGLGIARMGLASMFTSHESWAVLGISILAGLFHWGLFYLLAVAAVSPRSSNRMFPLRVFLTLSWLIFGVVLGIWSWVEKEDEPVLFWVGASIYVLSVALCFILAERESWTPRVRRRIPRGEVRRALAWLVYTGSAGGVIWCALLGTATLLAGNAIVTAIDLFRRGSSFMITSTAQYTVWTLLGVFLFAWCYSMSGLFVRRMIVPRSAPPLGTVIGLILLAVGGSLPLLLAYLIQGPNWQFEKLPVLCVVTNPFVLERTGSDRDMAYTVLFLWAFLATAANFPWFYQQWHAFRRYEPRPAPPFPAPIVEEPPVVHV